ncbi:MAG: chromosomal replication initiator protein DnaA [Ruminococcaceae bacterium]|nr:chromosomal replication initiator protein DnaA [Oscillospiraceae bacterium]
MQVTQIWENILKLIEPEVTNLAFTTWFKDIRPVAIDDKTIILSVSNDLVLSTIKRRYIELIKNCVNSLIGEDYNINFVIGDNYEPKQQLSSLDILNNNLNQNVSDDNSYINSRYTFETFVVGNSNYFAHAAAVAVAEAPAQAYNPLFLYGDSGLGKTHLMHAIANYAKIINPSSKIVYISSEKFTNELVTAISTRTTSQFRSKYRNADILLIDDIQFLAGKEMAQEEFFHTFNDLYNANKQIVLTSDRLPREIPTLEDRLRTRFESGLIGDIKPPDYETRIAILQKMAEQNRVEVPYDVYCYMADNIKSNIRELEGALTRIISYSRITGKIIDMDLAVESLSTVIEQKGVIRITAKSINEAVSKYYNIPIEDIKGKRKTQDIADARQVAMYLCRKLTDMSFVVIGKEYSGRHYTTVMHAVDNIEESIKTNSEVALAVETMTKQLKTILG